MIERYNKKIIYIIIIILIFLFGILILSFHKSNVKKEKKPDKVSNNQGIDYKIFNLSPNANFTMNVDYYDNGNKANINLFSKRNFSYCVVEIVYFNDKQEMINLSSYSFDLVSKDGPLIINVDIDRELIASATINITCSDDDDKLVVYNRNLMIFDQIDSESNLTFVAQNNFDTDLIYIGGYIIFYSNNKVINTVPFEINGALKDVDISYSIEEPAIDYDKVIMHVNEIV